MTWKTSVPICVVFCCLYAFASSLTSTATSSTADKTQWIRYADSAEGAFSIDVPLGWQVQGGMYRFGYFDVRWMIDIRSLDGKAIVRLDDVNIPPYALPGPRTGREGQTYAKPQQFQMVVARYQEAQPYAELYAKHRFSQICRNMTPRAPDWTPSIPAKWEEVSNAKSSDAAVSFNCDTSDGPRVATVFVRNTLDSSSAFWVAMPISILSAPDRLAQVHAMTQHMIDSWEKNPQWVQYQDQLTQVGLQQIRANFSQFMQQMQAYHQARSAAMNQQVAGYMAHQQAQAQQASSWGETLTGLVNVSDPKTGTQFQVFSGPQSNYYVNGLG
ncbi:MAG: hypothetical protein WBU20_03230, partial [Candidatus Acidiferrum sp.]